MKITHFCKVSSVWEKNWALGQEPFKFPCNLMASPYPSPPLFSKDFSSSRHHRLPSHVYPTPRPLVYGPTSYPRVYFVGHWASARDCLVRDFPWSIRHILSSSLSPGALLCDSVTTWVCLAQFLTHDIIVIHSCAHSSRCKTCVCYIVDIQ